jgi:cellulose synthase/poly-beta-1,6-N-acetylglucosamine synthase-like glycosyltransferase
VISIVIISKDEPSLDYTLTHIGEQARFLGEPFEIIVVDASEGRLDHIRERHAATVRWVPFQPIPGLRISIPHQRNVGVRAAAGEIIAFTDAGCTPASNWLSRLVGPLRSGEQVTSGITLSAEDGAGLYDQEPTAAGARVYLPECPTINLAFSRAAFDAVGGFDEGFAYGSDVDFSWRLNDAGYRILSVPDAVIRHDWGTWRRQLRRSYQYGKARLRLYRKHRQRFRHVLRTDPMVVVYPVFLLGLPLTLVFPLYPALLLIPAWRNRSRGVIRVLADHLTFGLGVLAELIGR